MKNKKNEIRNEIIEDPSKQAMTVKLMNQESLKMKEFEKELNSLITNIEKELKETLETDSEIANKDTVLFVKKCFDKIIDHFEKFSSMTQYVNEQLYAILYNISILFYEYCNKMRSYNHSADSCKYLLWVITNMESNIVLSDVKYLNWRIKLYVELALCYEDNTAYKAAYKVITQCISKFNELKVIEEQQSPLPDHIKSIFDDSGIVLKTLDMKFGLLVYL